MLISLSYRFVYISGLKVASTSMERILRPYSEIALVEAQFGKHQSMQQFQDRFMWLFEEVPFSEFFIFGFIREPVSFAVSLYNSHVDPKFKNRPELFIGDMNFDDFLDKWAHVNADMMCPQHQRFLGHNGLIGANLILPYEDLHQSLPGLAVKIGVPELAQGNLPKENTSVGKFSRDDLTSSQLDRIETAFYSDIQFRQRYCGRMLHAFEIKAELS